MADELAMDSGALIFATLADVYLSSGMIDEAISILKDGLSRNPTYTLAKIILGRAYYMKSDIQESIKVLEEVYKETKDSEHTNLYLGHCYKKLGDKTKAIEYYQNTLQVNSDNKEAQQELQSIHPEEVAPQPEPAPVTEEPVVVTQSSEPVPEEAVVPQDIKAETIEEPSTEPLSQKEEQPISEETVDLPSDDRGMPPIEQDEVPVQESESPIPREDEKPDEVPVLEPAEEPVEPAPPADQESSREDVPSDEPLAVAAPVDTEEPVALQEQTPADAVVDVGIVKSVPETPVVPLETLDAPVHRLLAMKAVKGAFVCSKDGLLIQNYYKDYPAIEELCAMVAAIHNEATEAFKFLDEGEVEKFVIEKGSETICVITAGESLLVVITKAEAKPGLVFIYARKIIEEIREILG